jgi:hypothetical protein
VISFDRKGVGGSTIDISNEIPAHWRTGEAENSVLGGNPRLQYILHVEMIYPPLGLGEAEREEGNKQKSETRSRDISALVLGLEMSLVSDSLYYD